MDSKRRSSTDSSASNLSSTVTATDLAIFLFCLLRLAALWVVFLIVEVVMFAKILKSKTMWLAALVGLVPALPGVIEAVGPLLGPDAVQKASAAVGVLIAVTRVFTNKPLSAK